MASYHLSVKPISRATGRSATAAAAYRAGERIECDREGKIHDYTRRSGVEYSEIVLPMGAVALDRQALWNAAESAEKRKDARVAREFEIALPVELQHGQRVELATLLAREISERHGCAVDIAIHAPGDGDDRNHHAHLLTTTRQLGPQGLGAKCRELDDQKRGPEEVSHWRNRWAELQNEALEKAGFEVRVTHLARTAEQIAAGQEPTLHLGHSAAEMEQRGMATDRGNYNRAVAQRNAERRQLRELIAESEGQIRVMARQIPTAKVPVPELRASSGPKSEAVEKPAKGQPNRSTLNLTPDQLEVGMGEEYKKLTAERTQRLADIEVKARKREQRRLDDYKELRAKQPQALGGRGTAQEAEHARWRAAVETLVKLARQARALTERIGAALQQVNQWANQQLQKRYPKESAIVVAHQAQRRAAIGVSPTAAPPVVDADRMAKAEALARLIVQETEKMDAGGPPPANPKMMEAVIRYAALRETHGPRAAAVLAKGLAGSVAAPPVQPTRGVEPLRSRSIDKGSDQDQEIDR